MAKGKKNNWIPWSEEEVKLLRKLYPKGKARQVSEQTGRPLKAVRQKAYDMGLAIRPWRRWSANEIKLLKKLHSNQTARSIADILGRSASAVKGRSHIYWGLLGKSLFGLISREFPVCEDGGESRFQQRGSVAGQAKPEF